MTKSELSKELKVKGIKMTSLFICETAKGEEISIGILSDSYYAKGYILKYRNEYYSAKLNWSISPENSYISLKYDVASDIFDLPFKTDLVKIKIKSFGNGDMLNAKDTHNSGRVIAQTSQFVNIADIKRHIKTSAIQKSSEAKDNANKQVAIMIAKQEKHIKGSYAHDYFTKGFDYAEEGNQTGI